MAPKTTAFFYPSRIFQQHACGSYSLFPPTHFTPLKFYIPCMQQLFVISTHSFYPSKVLYTVHAVAIRYFHPLILPL